MKRQFIFWLVLFMAFGAAYLFSGGTTETTEYMSFSGDHGDQWNLKAENGLLIGGYGHNFVYDGEAVKPVGGTAMVEVNAAEDKGKMEAVFNGSVTPEKGKTYEGEIKLVYETFSEGSDFWEGGIADFVYLHGDTGQEAPVMPKVKAYLASWGAADVYVDGELIYEDLVGHMMYTEGSRDRETYALYDESGNGYYSPKEPADGSIAHPDKRELHFVAHTTEPDEGNFPPHTVWIHLNFLDVSEM